MSVPRLGVNIDHVATLRQARGGIEPDPVWAAAIAEMAGADGITVHLREDRRHIGDRDVQLLRETVQVRLNLEASLSPEILEIALKLRPDQITLVPERRQEITTEGGLDVLAHRSRVAESIARFHTARIPVSLFIDPDPVQVQLSAELGAEAVELHTGAYAEAWAARAPAQALASLGEAGAQAIALGLALHAGHGLNYLNTPDVARIPGMAELNIGHSIISRAVLVGLDRAVREMKSCIRDGLLTKNASF
jgi:pyridoxine 5-phosphate synthase